MESFEKLKDDEYKVNVTLQRNYKFHKKFMALINMAYHNQEATQVFEHFRKWMIIEAGYYDIVTYPNGTSRKEAKSISFANMDESEFEKLYSDMVQVVIMVIKADEETIMNELLNFM